MIVPLRELEKNLEAGFVLGKDGRWCTINEAIVQEKDYIEHLERGEILYDNKWVSIYEVKRADKLPRKTCHTPKKTTENVIKNQYEEAERKTDTVKIEVVRKSSDSSKNNSNDKENPAPGEVGACAMNHHNGTNIKKEKNAFTAQQKKNNSEKRIIPPFPQQKDIAQTDTRDNDPNQTQYFIIEKGKKNTHIPYPASAKHIEDKGLIGQTCSNPEKTAPMHDKSKKEKVLPRFIQDEETKLTHTFDPKILSGTQTSDTLYSVFEKSSPKTQIIMEPMCSDQLSASPLESMVTNEWETARSTKHKFLVILSIIGIIIGVIAGIVIL